MIASGYRYDLRTGRMVQRVYHHDPRPINLWPLLGLIGVIAQALLGLWQTR